MVSTQVGHERLPMKKLPILILLILSLVVLSNAEQIVVRNVRELIKPSDVIARVSVVCVIDTGAREGYSKIAYAKVTDPIKGIHPDSILEIENDDAGVVCPNVSYAEGEDVLVFATKMANGHYQTLYAETGKFLIKNDLINKHPFRTGSNYASARQEVEREMGKPDRK